MDFDKVVPAKLQLFLDEEGDRGFGVLLFRRGDVDIESLKTIASALAREKFLPISFVVMVTETGNLD